MNDTQLPAGAAPPDIWGVQASLAAWDVWSALPAGKEALAARAERRLVSLVQHARAHSRSIERIRILAPWAAEQMRVFSILEPLPRLVAALNDYAPALLATYPTAATLLAPERTAGRLAIEPAALWLGGEALTEACRARIEEAFGCRIHQEYSASG